MNPVPTVDLIIRAGGGIVLVRRKNPPLGWALPGGFVDVGETLEAAAAREALEETGLVVRLERQFHAYSDPARDPRQHTISTVFLADADGVPRGGDDAAEARVFPPRGTSPARFRPCADPRGLPRRSGTERAGSPPAAGRPAFDGPFTAIDFETADYGADSACALALVHVEGLEIVGRDLFMIRPPRARFAFTHIHGITWAHVRGEPSFAEHWPRDRREAGRGDVPRRAQRLVRPRGARRLLRRGGGRAARAGFSLHGAARPARLAAPGAARAPTCRRSASTSGSR